MGDGWKRAIAATKRKPRRWNVYHQATVRPFSATLEGSFIRQERAETFAEGLTDRRLGRVEVVNPDGLTVKSWGTPGPDVEETTNTCEHGDHPAPPLRRFCSKECQTCEETDQPTNADGTSEGCAGLCRLKGDTCTS